MKLISWEVVEDFGNELAIKVLKTKKFTLFYISFGWYQYSVNPSIHMNMGSGSLLSIFLSFYKFGLDLSLFALWDT